MPKSAPYSPAMFVTWSDEKGKALALADLGRAYARGDGVVLRSQAGGANSFRDISSPNVSVRDGFDRDDYDYFRPGEALPRQDKYIQAACLQAYDRFALVRNVIDMMADFVCKGVRVVHESPRNETLGREWAGKVKMREVSGKIASMLFRGGSAPVRRKLLRLKDSTLDALRAAGAAGVPKGTLPMAYYVLNPATIEVVGGEIVPFVDPDQVRYAVRIPTQLLKKIRTPAGAGTSAALSALPADLLEAAYRGDKLLPLDPATTRVLHYKKDDFLLWAKPILYPLLDDLQMLNKLKQADRSALDGAISHIRLWRLGNIEAKIVPSPAAISKLAEMLLHNVGGGVMDLIWGPELDLTETSTDIHRFLGLEKYVPTLSAIYQGLGVPPSLTGTAGDGGMTNNFVSLRVLLERLDYCRQVLVAFWAEELAVLQATFGVRKPYQLAFDVPVLSDDSAEKKLLIDLIDRDVVSPEFVQERFGADPDIESARLRRNQRQRQDGKVPPKAGPYHLDSQQPAHLQRVFAQQGEVTPSEVGVDLKPRKPGEVPPAEKQAKRKAAEIAAKKPPKPAGRPAGAKDDGKRKQKRVSPKQSAAASYASALIWADGALRAVDEATRAPFLRAKGKANLRKLTVAEADLFERVKFGVLCRLPVGSAVTPDAVGAALAKTEPVPAPVAALYRETVEQYAAEHGEAPTVERTRQIQAMVYALYQFDDGDGSAV
jgi:hypothetical protein